LLCAERIQGGLEIQVTPWMWSQLEWRYLKYDYVSGGFSNKTDLNGPFIQFGSLSAAMLLATDTSKNAAKNLRIVR
jgi:hypothetical protein